MSTRDDRTKEVHRFICSYWQSYGFTPTLSEIAENVGFRSNGGVLRHLDKLEKWRWIERYHGQPRSITLLKTCDACQLISSSDIACLAPRSSQQR